jgi:hypothetical protein
VSIATSELVAYASANVPDDDSSTAGGAIDPLRYVDFTQIAANDTIQAVSDGADTRNITVEGRNAAGSVVSETKALTGAVAITFATLGTVERVLKAELASGDAARTVTIRRTTGPTTIRTLPPNKRGFMMIFRKVASDPSATKEVYEKFFFKNENGSLSLLSATVAETADPDNRITFALAAAVDDSGSVANRLTAPAALTFNNTTKNVPGTDLAAGSAIGVWLNLSLTAGDSAHKTTVTYQLAGQST